MAKKNGILHKFKYCKPMSCVKGGKWPVAKAYHCLALKIAITDFLAGILLSCVVTFVLLAFGGETGITPVSAN